MPRYEFVEGTSSKFWEITLDGKSFETKFGKIGTAGQASKKSFGSDAEAKKEYDKLVAEKTKKGYQLVGGGGGDGAAKKEAKPRPKAVGSIVTGPNDARNPELEAALIADLNDRQAWAVFGDWLQEQGDPRGELVSLQLANKDKAAAALIEKRADYFLGKVAEHQVVHDEGANNSASRLRSPAQEEAWQKTRKQAFLWRNGFIWRVRLSHDSYSDEAFKGKTADILRDVLEHPSARFVTEFSFQSNGDPNEDNLQDLIDVLAEKAPVTTRKITFGDNIDQISWHHTGDLGKLWKGVPSLKTLEIETGEFDVGKMDAPNLERAIFMTGGLSQECGQNIAKGSMPNIKHLEIYYGTEDYGGTCTVAEAQLVLARTDLTHLEYLGLKNSEFADELARAIKGAKVLKTLKTLDLSQGTMSDEGAEALAAAKDSLKHLECLDLTRNFLTEKGKNAVKGICAKVITAGQETSEDEDDRYVAVAE